MCTAPEHAAIPTSLFCGNGEGLAQELSEIFGLSDEDAEKFAHSLFTKYKHRVHLAATIKVTRYYQRVDLFRREEMETIVSRGASSHMVKPACAKRLNL